MSHRYDMTTTAEPTYQVTFRSGKVYTLTQAQLDANPQLQPYAKLVTADVLEVEQDFADDPGAERFPSVTYQYNSLPGRRPPHIEERGTIRKRTHAEAPGTEDVPKKKKRQRRSFFGLLRHHP